MINHYYSILYIFNFQGANFLVTIQAVFSLMFRNPKDLFSLDTAHIQEKQELAYIFHVSY